MNGDTVRRFEQAFAAYVGAEYAIAMANGTCTLHTALATLGVGSWVSANEGRTIDKVREVAVPPLTMASTTIAVLHAGGAPVFVDVDPDTWLMEMGPAEVPVQMPVDLYGLHTQQNDWRDGARGRGERAFVVDAAQTLRPHESSPTSGYPEFTSYSFQASKILSTGEGGMLVTNDAELAKAARRFVSLGYDLDGGSSTIDPATLKHPTYARHHSLGYNYRMADAVAERGLMQTMPYFTGSTECMATNLLSDRRKAAALYREAHAGCSWIKAQHVPEGWTHDYWTYAVAIESAELWQPFTEAIVRHGGEMPYGAWRITYQEPAFRHLAEDGTCPIAEDLQPRLVQAQTNDLESARRNADAWSKAIQEING